MANFLEGLGNILKHPIDEAKWLWEETENVGKNLLRGDVGEAFDQVKGSFGRHNEMMSENIAVPLGGHNKITENPDAVAGAVIGGVMAAPAVAAYVPTTEFGSGALNLTGGEGVAGVNKYARFGNVLQQMGGQISQGSSAPRMNAPAFKPQFQMPQQQGFGSDVLAQMGAQDYNIRL